MPKQPAARSAFFRHTQPGDTEENLTENVNANVHATSVPEESLLRRRGGEERRTATFRVRPSVVAAFDAWCEERGYAKGLALEAAIEAFMARADEQS